MKISWILLVIVTGIHAHDVVTDKIVSDLAKLNNKGIVETLCKPNYNDKINCKYNLNLIIRCLHKQMHSDDVTKLLCSYHEKTSREKPNRLSLLHQINSRLAASPFFCWILHFLQKWL